VTNINILSLEHLLKGDCSSGIGSMQLFSAPETVPESLMPTELQRSTAHESWIDLLPSPRMRDNAIRLAGTFDNDDLCIDLIGGMYEDSSDHDLENNGMLAWTDPWHIRGWELTEGFVKKWGFLLQGCQEMIDVTNGWRAVRNQEPLIIEL
jgi:hypothetical protein